MVGGPQQHVGEKASFKWVCRGLLGREGRRAVLAPRTRPTYLSPVNLILSPSLQFKPGRRERRAAVTSGFLELREQELGKGPGLGACRGLGLGEPCLAFSLLLPRPVLPRPVPILGPRQLCTYSGCVGVTVVCPQVRSSAVLCPMPAQLGGGLKVSLGGGTESSVPL